MRLFQFTGWNNLCWQKHFWVCEIILLSGFCQFVSHLEPVMALSWHSSISSFSVQILIKSMGWENDEGLALGRKRGSEWVTYPSLCTKSVSEWKAGFKLFNSQFLELIFRLLLLPFIYSFCHLFFPLSLMHFVFPRELFLSVISVAACVGIVGTSCWFLWLP